MRGRYKSIHVMTHACHHPKDMVHVTHGTNEVEIHIKGIRKPFIKDPNTSRSNEGLVLDARLFERVS